MEYNWFYKKRKEYWLHKFKFFLCLFAVWSLISFQCWVIFHCLDGPQFTFPPTYWGTSWSCPGLGHEARRCCEYPCVGIWVKLNSHSSRTPFSLSFFLSFFLSFSFLLSCPGLFCIFPAQVLESAILLRSLVPFMEEWYEKPRSGCCLCFLHKGILSFKSKHRHHFADKVSYSRSYGFSQ